MSKIAIIYYSATGHTYQVAQAVEQGAQAVGAETRLRRVRELAAPEAIAANPKWQSHLEATADVLEASHDDLTWADGFVFGTPTRFGAVSAQLKLFLDSTGPLWGQGQLANKVGAAFTGASHTHGGQEATLLTIYNVLYHWGTVVVPMGYTDQTVYAAGGNPYGVSFTGSRSKELGEEIFEVARYQGRRIAQIAEILAKHRAEF